MRWPPSVREPVIQQLEAFRGSQGRRGRDSRVVGMRPRESRAQLHHPLSQCSVVPRCRIPPRIIPDEREHLFVPVEPVACQIALFIRRGADCLFLLFYVTHVCVKNLFLQLVHRHQQRIRLERRRIFIVEREKVAGERSQAYRYLHPADGIDRSCAARREGNHRSQQLRQQQKTSRTNRRRALLVLHLGQVFGAVSCLHLWMMLERYYVLYEYVCV
mmetsp:Transcript_12496/g.30394  ORF Transcript_12496/g.30394 Transcript_12496/m.30394 type:complete len:216 (+) Transcript_12496:792-1439(+)